MNLEGAPLLAKMNSGWNRLNLHWRLFQVQRQISNRVEVDQDQPPVVFFNASTRLRGLSQNAAFSLITAWAVQLAGVPVIHFACRAGMTHCVLGTVRGEPTDPPPCQGCIADSIRFTQPASTVWFEYEEDKKFRAVLDGLTLMELKDFEYQGRPLGSIVLPSLRWALRRYDLEENKLTRGLFTSYILSAQGIANAFSRLLDHHSPQAVVVFNGLQYPEVVVRQVAIEHNTRVITHEVGFQRLSAFFTEGEATKYPIEIPETFRLSGEQNERLDKYLQRRFKGNFTMAGIQFWPEMRGLDEALGEKLDRFEGVVPIFTNVVFDTSQTFANAIFSNMFDWLETVVKIIKAHPRMLFVLRAHPDEMRAGKESRQSVASWVEEEHLTDFENVIFLGPERHFSSYELIKKSKFVMVYNSSIGLEASLLEIPVLCGARARYTRYPIVIFPDSREEYLQKAKEFVEADRIEIPERLAVNARRFLYYQFFKVSLPFDAFLEEYPESGYVSLKRFPISSLERESSPTIRTLLGGILDQADFVLDG